MSSTSQLDRPHNIPGTTKGAKEELPSWTSLKPYFFETRYNEREEECERFFLLAR